MSRAFDLAYDTIREMIVSGVLAPGDPLGEEALAEICGVSRTPVRDAMRRLEAEMLIRRSESQRSFVADWSLDDVSDAFELRAMLEGMAARRAATRISPEEIGRLEGFNQRIGRANRAKPTDIDVFLEENRKFHTLILDVAGSARLKTLLQTLIEQPVVWRTAHHYSAHELLRSHQEHDELIAAFKRGDAAWAEAIMSSHIRRAFHAYSDAHHELAMIEAGRSKKRA